MLRRLRNVVRTLGWSDATSYLAAALLSRVSRGSARLVKYYFVAQPVPQAAAAPGRASAGMRLYATEAVDDVLMQAPRPPHVIAERFAQGARCFVAERDGELAGCIWVCPVQYREDEVRCLYRWTPGPAAMWDFDVYIAPRWRMSRLFARLWERAHAELGARGVGWTLSRIDAFNAASRTSHRKLGARDLACGWFLRAGPLQVAVLSMRPFVHATLARDGGPRLTFELSKLSAPGTTERPVRESARIGLG